MKTIERKRRSLQSEIDKLESIPVNKRTKYQTTLLRDLKFQMSSTSHFSKRGLISPKLKKRTIKKPKMEGYDDV